MDKLSVNHALVSEKNDLWMWCSLLGEKPRKSQAPPSPANKPELQRADCFARQTAHQRQVGEAAAVSAGVRLVRSSLCRPAADLQQLREERTAPPHQPRETTELSSELDEMAWLACLRLARPFPTQPHGSGGRSVPWQRFPRYLAVGRYTLYRTSPAEIIHAVLGPHVERRCAWGFLVRVLRSEWGAGWLNSFHATLMLFVLLKSLFNISMRPLHRVRSQTLWCTGVHWNTDSFPTISLCIPSPSSPELTSSQDISSLPFLRFPCLFIFFGPSPFHPVFLCPFSHLWQSQDCLAPWGGFGDRQSCWF